MLALAVLPQQPALRLRLLLHLQPVQQQLLGTRAGAASSAVQDMRESRTWRHDSHCTRMSCC